MTETVLVTGGTGYVASWCIVRLLEEGYDVRTTARRPGNEAFVADLLSDDGWAEALDGCDYVLHVASPLGGGDFRPAREGTLRVLRLAAEAGVKRVVMTSAAAAATPVDTRSATVTDESLWTDPDGKQLSVYQRSKVLAERAAWDFMAGYDGPMTLTTILPGAVFGPIVSTASRGSTDIIERLMKGRVPANPRIALEVVDVRDLADLHILAMRSPEAAGQRFIGVSGDLLWMSEISQTLRDELGDAASKVPTRTLPDLVLRIAAFFSQDLRTIASALGRRHQHTAAKARTVLGWQPRPGRVTVVDCARSLIDHGVL